MKFLTAHHRGWYAAAYCTSSIMALVGMLASSGVLTALAFLVLLAPVLVALGMRIQRWG
jgi:predicted RND superfamily exporter protein